MKLSKNFSLSELTRSDTASQKNIDNTPNSAQVKNLTALAQNVLQPARDALGVLYVTSGFRSDKLNEAVGGSDTSQHLLGEAADIKCSDNLALYLWIKENVEYDQLILEYHSNHDPSSGWVHVSYKIKNRNQAFTIG